MNADPLSPAHPTISRSESDWKTDIPPPDLTQLVAKTKPDPVGAGAYADVYMGTLKRGLVTTFINKWSHEQETEFVAVKTIRQFVTPGTDGYEKVIRRLDREIALWQRLDHENIQRFLGVVVNHADFKSGFKAIVSPWQANGSVKTYLQKYPDANRYELLRGIASGLAYLHANDPQITHGDIKPDNILVTDWGTPCLADFGISAVHEEATFWVTGTTSVPGTPRYMAPELLNGRVNKITSASDVYAYAISAYEILTDIIPFNQYRNSGQLAVAIANRDERPIRPQPTTPTENESTPASSAIQVPNSLWELWEKAWSTDDTRRPSMAHIESFMERLCSEELPLRLLSIDGTGARVLLALTCLKEVMDELSPGARPCEHFELIGGSGTGGMVALMLGRLRMTVDECIQEINMRLPKLHSEMSIDDQKKRLKKNKTRITFVKEERQSVLREIVNNVLSKGERDMRDRRADACRTFVIGHDQHDQDLLRPASDHRLRTYKTATKDAFAHRVWVGMSSTLSTPLMYGSPAYGENLSLEGFVNSFPQEINPAIHVIEEAKELYGNKKRVTCFISLGTGLNSDEIVGDDIPESYAKVLRDMAGHTDIVDTKIRDTPLIEHGSYYRFDPVSAVQKYIHERSEAEGERLRAWQEVIAYDHFPSIEPFVNAAKTFMDEENTRRMAKECAKRLHRPMRRGNTIRSSTGTSTTSITKVPEAEAALSLTNALPS